MPLIVENKNTEYPIDEYHQIEYMPQAEEEIKDEKEQKDSNFLQTATEYYSKEIKATKHIENQLLEISQDWR